MDMGIGIHNATADSNNVECKRTLTHTSGRAYHFYYTKLLDAWTGSNDNVAMGGACQTDSRDFYNCVNASSNAESWDDTCGHYSEPWDPAGVFVTKTSNLEIEGSYLFGAWDDILDLGDHPAELLAHYDVRPLVEATYEDNVGYDTLISSDFGKVYSSNHKFSQIESELNIYPNPFNEIISFSGNIPLEYSVYDISGRRIITLSGDDRWKPEANTKPGIYLIKARMPDNRLLNKRVVYLK